jgi:hypothetical protein
VVPAPIDNAAAEAYRPPELKGVHAIEGVGVSASGQVALALSASSQVSVFAPTTGSFSALALPPSTSANSVAFTSDGVLVAGLTNYQTQLMNQVFVSALGRSTVGSISDSSAVVADGTSVVVGGQAPTVLSGLASAAESQSAPAASAGW